MGRSWGVWDGSFPDRKVFKSPSFPQINYTMKTIPSWAAAFCPAFPRLAGILLFLPAKAPPHSGPGSACTSPEP